MTHLLDRRLYSLCISEKKILEMLQKKKNILRLLNKEPEAPSYPPLNPAVYPIKTKINLEDKCSD